MKTHLLNRRNIWMLASLYNVLPRFSLIVTDSPIPQHDSEIPFSPTTQRNQEHNCSAAGGCKLPYTSIWQRVVNINILSHSVPAFFSYIIFVIENTRLAFPFCYITGSYEYEACKPLCFYNTRNRVSVHLSHTNRTRSCR